MLDFASDNPCSRRYGAHRASYRVVLLILAICALGLAMLLCGCGGGQSSQASGASPAQSDSGNDKTSGPAYSEPAQIALSEFDAASAIAVGSGTIDVSNASLGYVGATVVSPSRCKFQVVKGDMSYNYDMNIDGSPIIVPLNMGSGAYKLRIMQNTSASNYVELGSYELDAQLDSEFEPFLHPNIFCDYNASSGCVDKAFELASNAQNEGDVVRDIYEWIVTSIDYDTQKAAELANTSGYIPNPDDTYQSGYGICFDYASLAAAMFRSLGIPCQIITGYVDPDNLYHAWNMIYINGQWVSAEITVDSDRWTRIDLTFAAADGGNSNYTGNGASYTDRYVY